MQCIWWLDTEKKLFCPICVVRMDKWTFGFWTAGSLDTFWVLHAWALGLNTGFVYLVLFIPCYSRKSIVVPEEDEMYQLF